MLTERGNIALLIRWWLDKLKEILTNLAWFLAGLYLSPLLIVGFVYDLAYTAYKRRVNSFLMKFITLIVETIRVIFWFLSRIGLGIDILGNVVCGNMILHFATPNGYKTKNHLFRVSGVTISAALGQLLETDQIGKRGRSIARILDAAFFEDYHCEIAYLRHVKKLELEAQILELKENNLKPEI